MRKSKMVYIVIIMILFICFATQHNTINNYDINGDGIIDSYDLLIIRRYIQGDCDLDKQQLYYADINHDGIIDQKDLNILTSYILNQ